MFNGERKKVVIVPGDCGQYCGCAEGHTDGTPHLLGMHNREYIIRRNKLILEAGEIDAKRGAPFTHIMDQLARERGVVR